MVNIIKIIVKCVLLLARKFASKLGEWREGKEEIGWRWREEILSEMDHFYSEG